VNLISLFAKDMKRPLMSDIYAMRRANGDWFALKDQERLRVPLFRSTHDAMMARLRNYGMMLFKPTPIDTRLLKEIAPESRESDVDFCLVNDPFASLSRARPLQAAQLASLIGNRGEHQSAPSNGNGNGLHRDWHASSK
jgi:hypothetical protein